MTRREMTDKHKKGANASCDSALGQSISSLEDHPCVLQCSTCNNIIGDSTTFVLSNDILRTITLKYVSNKVNISEDLVVTQAGPDAGSTYHRLTCGPCDEEIGKMYICTPRKLDAERGLYTLFLDKLTSYQIGSCSGDDGPDDSRTDVGDLLSLSNVRKLNSHVQKLQSVVLSIDTRVSQIEQYINDATNMDIISIADTESVKHTDIVRPDIYVDHQDSHSRRNHTDRVSLPASSPSSKSTSHYDVKLKPSTYRHNHRPEVVQTSYDTRAGITDDGGSYSSSVKRRYSASQDSSGHALKKAKIRK